MVLKNLILLDSYPTIYAQPDTIGFFTEYMAARKTSVSGKIGKILGKITRPFLFPFRFVHKRFGRKGVIALIVILFLIIGFRAYSVRKNVLKVDTAKVTQGNLVESVTSSGKVTADQMANLTFQTSGKVAWVGVKEGDQVDAYQAIASLDKAQLELQLKKLLKSFDTQFTNFDDTNDSVKDDVLTDAVRRIKERAQNSLDQSVIDVEIQNEALKLATIVSPFKGIVVKAEPQYPGINVTPATASYVVVNPETTYFEAEVAEVDIPKIKLGQKVTIELDAYPNQTFEGEVQKIDFQNSISSTGGKVYNVKVSLPENSDLRFKLGMEGSAKIALSTKENVVLVPAGAIFEEGNDNYVWVIKDGMTEKRKVELGVSNESQTQITSGLSTNEVVVTLPSSKITEGTRVQSL